MTQQHQDLDSLNERADRILDGMTINRELFARDVKRMSAELAQWRNAHARTEAARSNPGFGGAFDDMFGGFGSARK